MNMNKTIVALLAAVMLIAFGYTVHSVKAAGSYNTGSNSGATSGTDRAAANTSRTDNMNQGGSDMGGQTGRTATTDSNRPLTSTSMDKGWADQHRVDNMIGKSVVNAKGDSLGTVKDFVLDDQGRINFAVVSHGGFLGIGATKVLVPYEALSFDGKGHFALNMTKDQLAAAPRFDEHNFTYFSDRTWTDQVYRYYGVQPRWSDTESKVLYEEYEEYRFEFSPEPGTSDSGTSESDVSGSGMNSGSSY